MITEISVTVRGFTNGSVSFDPSTDSLAVEVAPFVRGQDAVWVTMTQAQYDALAVKDPETLYLIVE